jgi:hypothetical protein
MTGAYVILFYWFSQTYNAFLFGYFRIRQLVLAQFFSQIFSVTIIYILVSIAWHKFQAPWVFLILLAIYLAIDILWAYFGSYTRIKRTMRTLNATRMINTERYADFISVVVRCNTSRYFCTRAHYKDHE